MCTSAGAGIFQINDGLQRLSVAAKDTPDAFSEFLWKKDAFGVSYLLFWNETASMTYAPFEWDLQRRQPSKWDTATYDPRNVSTLQNISVCPVCCVLKSCRGDIMSQGLCLSVSLSLVCAQMRSQVPKFGTEWFNVNRYSVVPTQFGMYP